MQSIGDLLRFVGIIEAAVLGGLLIALLWRAIIAARHQRRAGIKFDALSPTNLGLIIASYCLYLFGSILRAVNDLGSDFNGAVFINIAAGIVGIVGMTALVNFQNDRMREIEIVLKEANK